MNISEYIKSIDNKIFYGIVIIVILIVIYIQYNDGFARKSKSCGKSKLKNKDILELDEIVNSINNSQEDDE